jgi:hypothetical protein
LKPRRELSCREVVQLGEKLSIALSALIALDNQESFKYIDKRFEFSKLCKIILYSILKARFGKPKKVENSENVYSIVYRCIDLNGLSEAVVSMIQSADAGIIFTTGVYPAKTKKNSTSKKGGENHEEDS